MTKVKRDLKSLSELDMSNGPSVYKTLARVMLAMGRIKDITRGTTELADLADALEGQMKEAMKDNVILHYFLHGCIADKWRNRPDIGRLLFLVSANAPENMRFIHHDFEGHLIQAVYTGSCPHVQTLLEANADPNAVGVRMRTPLQLAIELGKVEIAIALINHEGTSLTLRDPNGRTPLQQCLPANKVYLHAYDPGDKQRLKPTFNDFMEIAAALLSTDEARGLDLYSCAPLSHRPSSANAFLQSMHDSSFPNRLVEQTWTSYENDDDALLAGKSAFELLLQRSDVDVDRLGLPHLAIELKLTEAFNLLLPKMDPNYSGRRGEMATPLAAALRLSPCAEKALIIEKLFERGADVNKPSRRKPRYSSRQIETRRYVDKLQRPIDIASAQDTPDGDAILRLLRDDKFFMYINSPTGRDPKPMHSILKADGLNPEEKWHLIVLLFIYGANIYDDHEDEDGDMMSSLDVIHGDESMSAGMLQNYECLTKLAHLDSVAKALLLNKRGEAIHLLKSNYVNQSLAPDSSIPSAWVTCLAAPMWANKKGSVDNKAFLSAIYNNEWTTTTHFYFHKQMREAIKAVMLVANRLDKNAFGEPSPDTMKRKRTVVHKETQPRKQHGNDDDDEDPLLPPEIWCLICSFFQRAWWGRTVGDPIVIDD